MLKKVDPENGGENSLAQQSNFVSSPYWERKESLDDWEQSMGTPL